MEESRIREETGGDSKICAGIRVEGASEWDNAEPGNSKFTAGKAEF